MTRARRTFATVLLGLLFGLTSSLWSADSISPEQLEFFETKIRPILAEQCYKCHNSLKQADGDLAVDFRGAMLKGGDGGPIIVPGQPAKSRLLPILRHEVVGMNMPQDGAKLDDRVIADFEKWIAMGAPDPREKPPTEAELSAATTWESIFQKRKQWWSFQPIRAVEPPNSAAGNWSSHPIDQFIGAKWESQGLAPVESATARVLVRRLYFALIGLPPTAEELTTWTARLEQPGGYSELVEHLIASPHFGERWARHWMDWIRYAETHGSEGDPTIDRAWVYRDYLIRALNSDVSFDQLVREHIAGDLLEQPRINSTLGINESAIGPAHWRMVFHGFAPTDPLDEKVRFIDDEINVFSKAFLGLTVACARCHDHKFDAISQKDYYALFGILGSCRPGRTPINSAEELTRNREQLAGLKPQIRSSIADAWNASSEGVRSQLLSEIDPAKKYDKPSQILQFWSQIRKEIADGSSFADAWKRREATWQTDRQQRAAHDQQASFKKWDLSKPSDYQSWFGQGVGITQSPSSAGEFAVSAVGEQILTGIYPSGAYTNTLTAKHSARFTSGYVRLAEDYDLWMRVIGDGGSSIRYVVQDYPRDGTVFPIRKFAPEWQWQKFDLTYWNGDEIFLELATGQDAPVIVNQEPRSWFGITEAVIVKKGDPAPVAEPLDYLDPIFEVVSRKQPTSLEQLADSYVEAIQAAITAWKNGSANNSQARLLDTCIRQGILPNRIDQLTGVKSILDEYRRLEAEIVVPIRVPGLQETVARNQPLFERGNHKTPSVEVPRRFLDAIDPTPYETSQSGRRQLAENLLRDDNPLTRRVVVNRIWHHLFGRGIVATPDNFGKLGIAPTHPELLDYLATRFQQRKGSIKDLVRFVVSSKTWQLSSRPSTRSRESDPDNQWLSHANLRRLEAEAIRDSILSASGTMNRELFGPPVNGSTPRRSIYVQVARNSLDPFLRSFDFPEPFSTVGRRDVTNVPAQSLTLMNDLGLEALAAAWANRVVTDPALKNDDERIQSMFVTALGRSADPSEITRLKQHLRTTKAEQIEIAKQVAVLREAAKSIETSIDQLKDPIRKNLLAARNITPPKVVSSIPKPISRWSFDGDLQDSIGSCHMQLMNGARIESDELVLNGEGYAVTTPITQNLTAKTLEAWVQLDGLDQGGGGVMTIQTRAGDSFDSIVFAEQSPRQWLAGSNFFLRTQPFNGPAENEAGSQPVHLAVVYHADGKITAYRNGVQYGQTYQSPGPFEFKAGEAFIEFGIRHLPPGGNRMIKGRLMLAQLYDRALSQTEVQASSQSAQSFVTDSQILAAMTNEERQQWDQRRHELAESEAKIKSWGSIATATSERDLWMDIARAMFTFQELIFIQ